MLVSNLYYSEQVIDNGLLNTFLAIAEHEYFKGKVFISIYENASKDRTVGLLRQFRLLLQEKNIPNRIITNHTRLNWGETYRHKYYKNISEWDDGNEGSYIPPYNRIKDLKQVRNLALAPLVNPKSKDEIDFFRNIQQKNEKVIIVFINDVIVSESDIIQLLSTNDGEFDAACAMDFQNFQIYDGWVVKDIQGDIFDFWYPYLLENKSLQKFLNKEEFRVFSCWNGVVAFDGKPIQQKLVKFRTAHPLEDPNPNYTKWLISKGEKFFKKHQDFLEYKQKQFEAQPSQTICYNSISECQLIWKDYWEHGYDKIYMNPKVQITYSQTDNFLNKYVQPQLNFFVLNILNQFYKIDRYTFNETLIFPKDVVCALQDDLIYTNWWKRKQYIFNASQQQEEEEQQFKQANFI